MKKYIVLAALSGATSVGLGAFGAHGLRNVLSETALNSFATGVRYQAIHSLLLLIVVMLPIISISQKRKIANILIAGIAMFSGSIYLLAPGLVAAKYLWFVTPLGGTLLLAAWLMIAFYTLKQKTTLDS
ncbi:uncharacterized membrane protein YgdD (TMEM256/DUF423 family) [Wenyingzhuangia heitensis]|uniref:Uncharacterized membrane protein YgdD (TMEM256/DUF423 family) n=1 Tax=Wenyingzhuangia heitensis TaxID=1487859 RepID=A0ABX0UEW3_9FLAO|nr:DUF423 domain-containing protein [Wenyingzhuangia heitensis]NIJ46071.1 uncharacterized membrane protein YgdD (TMEM256/DUF423 family) [Wenyingzhuangia heitensis]